MAANERQRIVDDTDGSKSDTFEEDEEENKTNGDRTALEMRKVSMDAIAKFRDYRKS